MSGTWSSGWVTGDVVTAAEFAKGTGAIYNTTLAAAAGTVDITGITGNYAHLYIVVRARTASGNAVDAIVMRLNGVASASYHYQYFYATAATNNPNEAVSQTALLVGQMPGVTTGSWGVADILIPSYANTSTPNRTYISRWFTANNNSTGLLRTGHAGGFSGSAAALTQITFLPGAGSFEVGSQFTVYAMGS